MTFDDQLEKAISLQSKGKVAEAVGIYQDILKKDPKQPEALLQFGIAQIAAGEFSKAGDLIKLSLTYNPYNAKAWCHLGIARQLDQQPSNAIEAFERALILDPDIELAKQHLDKLGHSNNRT